VLPLYGNGTDSEKLPPASSPPLLENQVAATELRLTVCVVPFSVSPEAGVNVKVALVRSRVVEYAMSVTLNPLVVIFVICTEPVVITGANA
jgi:hypothetical protein